MKTIIIIIFVCSICQFSMSQSLLEDQSYLDQSFWEFKVKLEEAVTKREIKILAPLLADTVLESKDGCGYCTTEEFLSYYFTGLESSNSTWETLQQIIRFGFTRRKDNYPESIISHDSIVFQAPSYLEKIDTDTELLVLGEKVNIREESNKSSRVIRQASYEVFNCNCNILTMKESTYQKNDDIWWIEVEMDNDKIGYIASELTSYDIIKELTVAKVNGKWKIISFFHAPGC